MTYIHAPVNVILPRSNGVTVELSNPERVVPIPSGAQGLPGEPGFSPVVSVEPITGGNRVTITDADGDTTFDVMDGQQGEQGEPGEGVPSGGVTGQVLKKRSNTDFDTYWANESGGVMSVNGQTGAVVLDADDVGALPDDTFIPTKTSDLTNDSGFTDVHVGASAPTDPDTQIWLDTDEPGQSAVTSFNGMSGAVTADYSTVGAISIVGPLWTNPNPTSDFAAQTVSLDLSGYSAVIVAIKRTCTEADAQWFYAPTSNGAIFTETAWLGSYVTPLSDRYIAVNTSGVIVSDCKQKANLNNTTAPVTHNQDLVPYQIYGIKGVLPL